MAVLNLGSGTGYLSTLFGLLVGSDGLNHGVERHLGVIEYAEERIGALMAPSPASPLNLFDFARPVFLHGNLLALKPPSDLYGFIFTLACEPSSSAFIRFQDPMIVSIAGQQCRRRGPQRVSSSPSSNSAASLCSPSMIRSVGFEVI